MICTRTISIKQKTVKLTEKPELFSKLKYYYDRINKGNTIMTKKQYIKPRALNLSGLAIIGFEGAGIGDPSPLGVCRNGSSPLSGDTCASGEWPVADSCNPQGWGPAVGGCNGGGNPSTLEGCDAGSIPT